MSETQKALANFISSGLPHYNELWYALADVKLAALQTNTNLGYIDAERSHFIDLALDETIKGQHNNCHMIDPLSGGAGTSLHMNINETIASRAMALALEENIKIEIHPLEHVNLHQSTNDVIPTAIHIAVYRQLHRLETEINQTLLILQEKEQHFANILKLGRTQLMPAVPTTLGKTFSAYAEVLGRDRWRLAKCLERIRVVTLGGTAIGTGIAAPRSYIFEVIKTLRQNTGLPLSRAENLVDYTQNQDALAEVFALVKVCSLNLEKIANDLRLMTLLGEISLPEVQAGSTIMPSKVNPVIPEMLIIIAKKVQGNELAAASCIAHGELELNAFLPFIGYLLLESLDILSQGLERFRSRCLTGLTAKEDTCKLNLFQNPASATLLIQKIGYSGAQIVADHMRNTHESLTSSVLALDVLSPDELNVLLRPESLSQLGYDTSST